MPANNGWDRFIMLLSADWFFDGWEALGLSLKPPTKRSIQAAARLSVRDFMNGAAAYWHVSFSDARLGQTRTNFLSRLKSSKLKSSEINSVVEVATNLLTEFDDDGIQKTLFLFYTLTADLLENSSVVAPLLELSRADIESIRDAFEKATAGNSRNEFERLLISSDSTWDIYLKSLTPDLPTYLSDWLSEIINVGSTFKGYWSKLRQVLNPMSRGQLLEWYTSEARTRGGNEFHQKVPQWLN